MNSGTICHVVVNTHGEGIGLLEHHADLFAKQCGIYLGIVDVLSVQQNGSVNLHIENQVVHTVQGFQKGGLSAAGRPDESGDFIFV